MGPCTHPLPTLCNFSVMELLIKKRQAFASISFQSSNIFYYQWCVVSMCCNSCPFLFWSYFMRVVFHTMQLTHDAHNMTYAQYYYLDNSGSDSRNLIGQLQVSKRVRNLERDSKCPGHLESSPLALRIPPTYSFLNIK